MVGTFEELVGGQLTQGQENLSIFEMRFLTNPHLVPGLGEWGFTMTPA